MVKEIQVWIARDEGYTEYDSFHSMTDYIDGLKKPGKLHLFYDTPMLEGYDKGGEFVNEFGETVWRTGFRYYKLARECCEIPAYMFPEIKEKTCKRLTCEI